VTSTEPSRSESAAHHELRCAALKFVLEKGFTIAAQEVSIPNRGIRADVAAYKPQRKNIGNTAIFEVKVSTANYRRDARSIVATQERLKVLHAKKLKIEEELKLYYPSIRNGDSLFQEFETLNFERPGYERYEKVISEMRQLSARLHENTKFDRLTKYASANLFYVVADDGVLMPHELPSGWGLLHRVGDELTLVIKPIWHDVSEQQRLEFLHRVAMRATRLAQTPTTND
jgi:hypothetical protein